MENEITGKMNEMAKELMDHEDVDTVQIVITFYDPIAGERSKRIRPRKSLCS